MSRRIFAPLIAAALTLAACGGDDAAPTDTAASTEDATDTTTTATDDTTTGDTTTPDTSIDATATTGASAPATLPEPAAVLEPMVDPTLVIGDDVGESLAALQFPRRWVLPEGGRAAVVGATVQYSVGETTTYTTYSTGYTVPAGDIEAVAEDWANRFADSLGIDGIERLGRVSNDVAEAITWSTSGDAEPGDPDLAITVSRTIGDTTGAMVVEARLESVDVALPDLVMPLDFDPTLPSLTGCRVVRFDVQYDGYDLPNDFPEDPNYTLWWEGYCPGLDAFDAAVAWAVANGRQIGEGAESFSVEATSEDDIEVDLSAFRTPENESRITLVVTQPFAGEQ